VGSYRITRDIAAPPDRVFRAFTDLPTLVDWLDGAAVNDVHGDLEQAGSRYTLVIRGPWRFRVAVVRSEPPWLHETIHEGPLGTRVRMLARLAPIDARTELELLTEYTMPLGALGRWIDRRWIDREPRAQANREVDRLVELVTAG
jgi:hypothetical protein